MVNADVGNGLPNVLGLCEVGIKRARNASVVVKCFKRGVGKRVYRVRTNEFIDIQRVAVSRVLG